jgi:hypothetical protein
MSTLDRPRFFRQEMCSLERWGRRDAFNRTSHPPCAALVEAAGAVQGTL